MSDKLEDALKDILRNTKDLPKLMIRNDSIEYSLFKDGDKPMRHFIRSHLTGLIKGLFDRKINLVETKCIAMGGPYCEFHIKP